MAYIVPSVICGSLPKPQWLAEPEKIWSPWLVPESSLRVAQIDAMRLSVEDQERAGLKRYAALTVTTNCAARGTILM